MEESAATCDLFSGGRWLANAPSLPCGVKKAGVATIEGKVFVMGGLITARDNRYHATAKVERSSYSTLYPLCYNVLLWLLLKVAKVCLGSR